MADIRIKDLATTATSAASDDYLALDGSANGTRKILATNVAQNVTDVTFGSSGPSAKSSIAARASRQGLVFDGTAGATVTLSPLGTSGYTVSGFFSVKSLAANNVIIDYGLTGAGVLIYVNTSGQVVILSRVSSTTLYASPSGTIVTDKIYHIAYSRGVGLFINGINVSGVFADTSNYSETIYRVGWAASNDSFWTGFFSIFIYNRALSASEVVALYEAGVPAGADYPAAVAGTSLSVNAFDATRWGSSYSSFTGASATGFTAVRAISGGDDSVTSDSFTVKKGDIIRCVFDMTNSGDLPYIYLGDSVTGAAKSAVPQTTAGTAQVFNITATSAATVRIAFYSGNAQTVNYTVANFSAKPIGLLLAPDAGQAGNGYVWNDMSGNVAQIALPSSGVTWNVPSVAGNRIRGTTNTNGNQQLLSASVLLPAESQILHVRARSRSGTPSITIGTASGGAQIVASVALLTTWQNLTIALTGGIVSSADDIWIGSNSTDVVEIDISWQPLDF
jgi:hypothetical protein